ncbi:MAG: histidine--tRNA ligase [Planctomycetales bacterium]|nr:histidine--tRNA ligase [Planctomycetales bacterium]
MSRPKARKPKGFRDAFSETAVARRNMLATICDVYRRYGFQPLETSAVEYVDALGKYLPESDQPDAGIFAFQDDLDEQWVALRYDLTAPLARVVAEHPELPKPFRRYQYGPVYRREIKPGKDRFREFYQCDFDTVGCDSMAADAEVCDVLAAAMRALGLDEFVIRVNNRKILNGLLDSLELADAGQRLAVLRTLDKLDDIGINGLEAQLGEGRLDKSGSFNAGVGLSAAAIDRLTGFLQSREDDRERTCDALFERVKESESGREGIQELREINELLDVVGLSSELVRFDPSLVRGLEYYTGPVFEIELPFTIKVKGKQKKFGSVSGGGRYDYLVERFTGQKVPATGASIGVDRLLAALEHLGRVDATGTDGPVVVTVMDTERRVEYQRMVQQLREAGIAAEMYLGSGGFKAQMKYADKRRAPIVVIAGSDEFERGEVTLKDMDLGAKLATEISDNEQWRKGQPAQITVHRDELVAQVTAILSRQ